jgi:tetratricopeptide (TPR) repeat protein
VELEELLNSGIQAFQAGNYQMALALFDQVLDLNSNKSDAWTNRGVVLSYLSRDEEAIASYDRAIEIEPNYYLAWCNRAVALENLGCFEEAIASCDQALSIQPDDPEALIIRAKQLYKLGRWEEAIISYDRGLALNPNYDWAWHDRGYALYKLSRWEESVTSFDQGLALNPTSEWSWNVRGIVLCDHLQRYEEAVSSFDRAITLKPDNYEVWYNRSIALKNLRRWEEVVASFDQTLSLKPDWSEVWHDRGAALCDRLQRYEEALASFDQAIAINPNNPIYWHTRGVALEELSRNEEALASYGRALALNPDDCQAWQDQGHRLFRLDRYAEAVVSYNRALALNPNLPDVWLYYGYCSHKIGRYEEAIASYDCALALNPNSFEAWESRAGALWELGRSVGISDSKGRADLDCMTEALISHDRAVAINPNSKKAWYSRGITLWNLGRLQEALASFNRAIEINPDSAPAWKMRGVALRDLGHLEEADISFDRALRLADNQLPTAWVDRGRAVLSLHGYKAALQIWDEGLHKLKRSEANTYQDAPISYEESRGTLYHCKGQAHYEYGRQQESPFPYWREARRCYQKALQDLSADKFIEKHLDILQDLIIVCRGLGQIKESQEILREGTDLLKRQLEDTPSPKKKILIEQRFAGFNQLLVDELVQSGKSVEALELAEERKNVCLSWLRYGWSDTVPSTKYQDIQQLLNSHTAAIYWHVSSVAITTFILRQNKSLKTLILRYDQPPSLVSAEAMPDNFTYAVAAHKLQDLENWLAAWKQDYQDYRTQGKPCWRQEMPEQLNELIKILNIPEILFYLSGIDQLILLPHRDLHLLPLHVLFPERFTVRYLPSAQVGLDHQQSQLKVVWEQATTSVLNVENSQENLPYAALESTAIAQLYPNIQHIRNSAVTQVAVTEALQSGAGIFHFSGHAEHNLNLPSESSLHLTNDERLTLRDIFELDMSSYNLVCLSACETGMTGKQGLIYEFVGLASGFLAAGTTNVVSSLWQVNDVSTAFLIIQLYENLRTCPTVAVALNQAQKWLRNLTSEEFEIVLAKYKPQIDRIFAQLPAGHRRVAEASLKQIRDRKPHPFANPYYWAAFTATGL